MSSMRIVLVDPLGDVLFSGDSLIARGPVARGPEELPDTLPAPLTSATSATSATSGPGSSASAIDSSEAMTERCPATMRSAGSGVYRAADRTRVSDVDVIEDVGAQIRAEATRRRLRRVG
jgi:hypothetical protein